MILDDKLVRSDADVEGVFLRPALSLHLSLFLRPEVGQDLQGRAPTLELHLPVDNDGGGHNDEVRTPDTSVTGQRGEQRDRLNGLSESHFISQYTVQSLIVQSYKPIETDDLVLAEVSSK